ncbi:MAG: methyltransferase [Gammaproteobacteria bacterium]
MIDFYIHDDLLIFLRAVLLLVPLFFTFCLGWRHKGNQRLLVGGLFSFLYSMGLLLPAHALAIYLGVWQYGGDTLMLLGMPADLWFAGSFLFGPAIFFAFPRLSPLVFTVGFVALQAFVFKSLDPFVISGDYWFLGVVLIFLFVHIPALYLARWTAFDTHLIERACLLAFGYGFLAFFVLPTLIMQTMGGEWAFLSKSLLSYIATALLLTPCVVMGLAAVHMFVVHGEGTPIPLDKTKHLVRSGIYAYITNPMQLCSALSWIIIGIFLQNAFVSLAAVMAVIFVLGLVRWHHRNDLQVRFPDGWPEYKENVPEWHPRWKPWIKRSSKFIWNTNSNFQRRYVHWLCKRNPIGMELIESKECPHQYIDGNRGLVCNGYSGLIYPLFHINFLTALIASGLLLFVIPSQLIKGEENATS